MIMHPECGARCQNGDLVCSEYCKMLRREDDRFFQEERDERLDALREYDRHPERYR